MNRALTVLCLAGLALASCKTKKTPVAKETGSGCRLESKNAKLLSAELKAHELKFQWLQAKIAVDSDIDSNSTSFNVAMRIRRDSAIWLSISPALGIEVARALITKDSVKFINRLKGNYFKGDFNYISRLLHTELDFEMVQSLLVGNSVEFYEEDEKLHASVNDCKYLLSTIRKRKLKRIIEKGKEPKEPSQAIWMAENTYKISRILFKDFNTNRSFDARYAEFTPVDSISFPMKVNYDILTIEKNVSIKMEYSKVVLNKPQTFPFSIPEKYEQLIYKEK